MSVLRNPDHWHGDAAAQRYFVSRPVAAHKGLLERVRDKLREAWPNVYEGMDATADSFYSSQGVTAHFLA